MDMSKIDMNDARRAARHPDPPPLKPAVFHILLALAEGATHGYAAMQAVREQSGGRVSVGTASFYRHLSRLMDDGLVAEAAARPTDDDPRRGAYYRLTPRGLRVLAAERTRLAALVAAIDALTPGAAGPRVTAPDVSSRAALFACSCAPIRARARPVRDRHEARLLPRARRARARGVRAARLLGCHDRHHALVRISGSHARARRSTLLCIRHGDLKMRHLFTIDWRDAWRSLRATPLVTAIAVLSLALGIGANTALFSILNSLILKSLPGARPAAARAPRRSEPGPTRSGKQIRAHEHEIVDGAFAWSTDAIRPVAGRTDGCRRRASGPAGGMFEVLGVPARARPDVHAAPTMRAAAGRTARSR